MMKLKSNEIGLVSRVRSLLRPPPKLTVSEWADSYRMLSAEASAEPGRWLTDRAPYQRGLMDAVSDPDVIEVVIQSSAQIGKTELVLNVLGYHVDQDPAPILVLQPTLEMAESFSKDRVSPMLRDTPNLQGKVKDPRARDSGNTMLHKSYPGGQLTMAGANSPASLASRPKRVILCDEVDRYPLSAGTEGDPVDLAKKRASTFHNKKFILVSTPTVKGVSRIEKSFEESDKRYFMVPCPHCGFSHRLEWKNVKWQEGKHSEAYMVCPDCGSCIEDRHKQGMLMKGEWVATAPFAGVAGFQLSELYSPWRKFGDTASDFLKAKAKGKEGLQVWTNTALGEVWEDMVGEGAAWESLYTRMENYKILDVPAGALVLTAGVDVQDNRLAVKIKGWGAGEESWLIYWTEIYGDPAGDAVWAELDQLLQMDFEHASGHAMRITATAIDSGGHHTQRVYAYARDRKEQNVIAIKGSSAPGLPVRGKPSSVDIDHKGRKIKGGAEVWFVGTDTAKALIYARMRTTDNGPGKMHFPIGLDETYFRGLTAEKRVTKLHKGFARQEWVKTYTRNEPLDCEVYALAAAYHAGIQRANWKVLTQKFNVIPSNEMSLDSSKEILKPQDEFPDSRQEVAQRPARRPPNRRGGGWISGWKNRGY